MRLAQNSRLYNLTFDVNNLKQEVRSLDMWRRFLEADWLEPQFHPPLLRHGLDMNKHVHVDFMNVCMDRGMHLGVTPFGIDMFFKQ